MREAYEMSTKEQLLDHLYRAREAYNAAIKMLHPSLNVYKDIFDAREAVKEIIMDIEDGKHDKVNEVAS
jgi:hypothetical protein